MAWDSGGGGTGSGTKNKTAAGFDQRYAAERRRTGQRKKIKPVRGREWRLRRVLEGGQGIEYYFMPRV
jgi:hypothetical protein